MDAALQGIFDSAEYSEFWRRVIGAVAGLGRVELAVLVIIGIGLLLAGWRIYKVSLILSALVGGALLGASIGTLLNISPLIPAGIGSVLCAVAVIPTQKVLFFFSGGAVGAIFVTPVLGHFFGEHLWPFWAVIGFAVIGVLAILLFKKIVIVATSFEGAFLVAFGAYFIIFGTSSEIVQKALTEPGPSLLITAAALGLVGTAVQLSWDKRRLLRVKEEAKD